MYIVLIYDRNALSDAHVSSKIGHLTSSDMTFVNNDRTSNLKLFINKKYKMRVQEKLKYIFGS